MNASFTSTNGEKAAGEAADAAGRMAGAASDTASRAAGAARETASRAASSARERADEARQWARLRWSDLQHSVEAQPYQSSAWALGIGFVVGMLVMGMLRGRR